MRAFSAVPSGLDPRLEADPRLETSKMHALRSRLPEAPYLHGKFPYFASAPKTVYFGRLLARTRNPSLTIWRNAKRPANTGFFLRIEVAHALRRPVPDPAILS